MAKSEVLARVKEDLAKGHTYVATQRLRTLIAIHPDDLELREMLAGVYRQTGNLAEAGRWGFLSTTVTEEELAAFRRTTPDPWLRLRMLRWSGDEALLPTEEVRRRLRNLVEEARRTGHPSIRQGPLVPAPSWWRTARDTTVPCLFVLFVLTLVGVLTLIGIVRAVEWLLGG